jgi:hypothetical protein
MGTRRIRAASELNVGPAAAGSFRAAASVARLRDRSARNTEWTGQDKKRQHEELPPQRDRVLRVEIYEL